MRILGARVVEATLARVASLKRKIRAAVKDPLIDAPRKVELEDLHDIRKTDFCYRHIRHTARFLRVRPTQDRVARRATGPQSTPNFQYSSSLPPILFNLGTMPEFETQ